VGAAQRSVVYVMSARLRKRSMRVTVEMSQSVGSSSGPHPRPPSSASRASYEISGRSWRAMNSRNTVSSRSDGPSQ
jgi:hypothetical protein